MQGDSDWQDDLKAWLTRTTASLDDMVDSGIWRLRKRHGRAGVPKIQAYQGYATSSMIRLHGRVLTNPPIDTDYTNKRWWQNLSDTLVRFASDEVPGVTVEGSFEGQTGTAISDSGGYFHIELQRKARAGQEVFWLPAQLKVVDHDAVDPDVSTTKVDVMSVPRDAEYGIISDVDDTILHTGATNIATMAKLTFFGNARTRSPLDGVAKLYQLLQHAGNPDSSPLNPLFYVSSSPWNLYDVLEDFLDLNAIPRGPLLLRDLGFDQNKFLKSGHDHKLTKARGLMNLYSDLPFVLFGDSGQEDARLYANAAKEFGNRIKAIFIRDIDPGVPSEHDRRTQRFVDETSRLGVPMYLVKDSTEVAKLAIEHGLLPSHSLQEIELATQRDRDRPDGVLLP